MAAHLNWRLNITASIDTTFMHIAEWQIRATAGGANQATGGTASASSIADAARNADKAFDGNSATHWQSSSFPSYPQWLRYQFASAVSCGQIAVTAHASTGGAMIKTFDVQWSDDGTTWTTEWTVSNQTGWAAGETRTFDAPAPAPYRVTAQSLEVLNVSAANVRVTGQTIEALVPTYEMRIAKAAGYVVLGIGPGISVSKAAAYAVLDDGTVPTSDPHWSNVVLLCHFDGSNGQTTTIDSSPSAHPISLITSTLATAQKKFGTASLSSSGGGSGAGLVNSGLADFQFGSGRFTVEAWVYLTSYSGAGDYIIAGNYAGNGPDLGWSFGIRSGVLAFHYSTDGTSATATSVGAAWTPTQNTWHHVAVDRDASNVLRVYLNGAVHASATVSATLWASTANLYLGNDGNVSRGWPGYIDDLRVTKGVSRYNGAFLVPQAAFPDTAPVVVSARRRPVLAFVG